MPTRLFALIPLFRKTARPGLERWSSRRSFLAVGMGTVLGLGVLWRFPALALTYGGGTFLIAYTVALVTLGIPALKLEQAVGHRAQRAAPRAFRALNKRWEWIGWWGTIVGMIVAVGAVVASVWALVFVGDALATLIRFEQQELPWARDAGNYFTGRAYGGEIVPGVLAQPAGKVVFLLALLWVCFAYWSARGTRTVGPVVRWVLAASLVLTLLVCVRLFRVGIFPDDGFVHGLSWALTPDWPRLGDLNLWLDAFGHAAFGLLLGTGVQAAMTSTLPRNADVTNNASLLGVASAGVTLVGYLAIASLLGTLALSQGQLVPDVVEHATGASAVAQPSSIDLLVSVYPRAFAVMAGNEAEPGGMLGAAWWAVALFGAIAGLGLVSAAIMLHGVGAALRERFALTRLDVGVVIGGLGLASSLLLASLADPHWLDTLFLWITRFALLPVVLLECVCAGYAVNTRSLAAHCNRFSERRLGITWELAIKLLLPLVLVVVLVQAVGQPLAWPGLSVAASAVLNAAMLGVVVGASLLLGRRRPLGFRRRAASRLYDLDSSDDDEGGNAPAGGAVTDADDARTIDVDESGDDARHTLGAPLPVPADDRRAPVLGEEGP